MAGKGDKRRPMKVPQEDYSNNWDEIFNLSNFIYVDGSDAASIINKLKPRTFNWRPSNEYPKEWDAYSETNTVDTEKTHHGFIAQEVKAVLDEYGVSESIDVWSEDEDGMQRVGETKFVTQLIKAVQELSTTVEELKLEIITLKGE